MKIKICPKCKAHNTESAILCAECYASLNGVAPVEDTGERPAKRVKICPKCGAENGATAVICGSCYTSLTDVVPSTETTASAPQFKTCPNCGTQNAVGATRCKTCYKPFEEQAENKPRSTQTQPANNTIEKPSDILPNDEDLNKYFGSKPAKTCKTKGFAYMEKKFGIFENDVIAIKDMVFNAPFIANCNDYSVFRNETYFLFNEKFNDAYTINAYADGIENIIGRYGIVNLQLSRNYKYGIVIYDGYSLVVSALAAAYVKFYPDLNFHSPEKIRGVLEEIVRIRRSNAGNFDISALKSLDEKFDLIPDNPEQIQFIREISTVALASTIAHEFGHIVSGHIIPMTPLFTRNAERIADKFAIDTINSLGDERIKNFFFLGALIGQLTLISISPNFMALELDPRSNIDHPANLERFRMLMEGTKATNHFGFTEEKYVSCIPLK